MDFGLSKEQLDIQKAVREFANAEFTKDYILELELGHKFPFELWKKACDLGFIAIDYPEEYGGQGYNLLERVLVTEEFCRQGGGVGNSLMLSNFGCKLILKHGSEEQKRKYLIPACQGEAISWAAFTEPDRGSDLVTFPLSTTSVRTNNGSYLINGTKTFITNATIASFGTVLCQTDFQAKPPYRGQSIMIVERDLDGVEVTEWAKMGMNYSPTTDLSLKNVRVSQENLLGEENRGFYYAMEFLNEVRIEIGAMGVGIAQGAFDRALNYSRARTAFGRKIGEFQAISHKLAEMATKIETARLLAYKAAFEFDNGTAGSKVCSMAKWYSARVAVEVADEAIEILGGHGYMLENEVERFYRDAKSLELVEGTREIHKNIIARNLLGRLS
ncbi:MAG TPA: acyl-CoA/acyl-ACP dehydrogenase [Dehalococcoidia bacterium]|nr:acyl-CoA/acyl-ACP dehydrogenase [Dehalococcoidia bacterium]